MREQAADAGEVAGMKDLFGEIDEEGMYQMAIRRPLAEKVEQAIALIRSLENQALQMSADGFYVCNSGGKDSAVIVDLAKKAQVRHTCNYSNVTIDPPELVRHLKKNYPDTIWHSVGTALPLYMGKFPKGPPTRIGRWCCEIYKEQGGAGCFKVVGVRAEESARRKGLWTQVKVDTRTKQPILSPILYWTEADVWEYIRANNIPYCELYNQGFKRLGCIGCPLSGSTQQRKEFDRWPGYERLWQRGFKEHMDRWKGVPTQRGGKDRWIEQFETWQDLWDWWLKNSNDTDQPDCQAWLW